MIRFLEEIFENYDKCLAFLIVIIAGILLFAGMNGEIKGVFAMASGYVFGRGVLSKKVTEFKKEVKRENEQL